MKVKDIIDMHMDFSFADTKIKFVVKPKGTSKEYFNSDSQYWINNPEIKEMEVERWMICDARGNKCTFVIIVKRDEEYEAEKEKAWKKACKKFNGI